jgi:beta-xylosidase
MFFKLYFIPDPNVFVDDDGQAYFYYGGGGRFI